MNSSELDHVNNVDLRFALAESEPELQQILDQLLLPLLLKFASRDPQVRQAVFRVIQNVFPRITAAPTLQLPAEQLLVQIQNPSLPPNTDDSTVQLYSLLFFSKSVERLSPEIQCSLVPRVVEGIHALSASASARMFNVLVKLLKHWKAPRRNSPEYSSHREALGFDKRPADEKYLSEKIGKFLLLLPTQALGAIPGLSAADIAFFTKDAGITYSSSAGLNDSKLRLLEFLKVGFSDQNLVLPLLIASTDALSTNYYGSEMRFSNLIIDYGDGDLINSIVNLYLGTDAPPANPTLQEKILAFLFKCPADIYASRAITIAEVGLSSEYGRLRQAVVRFIKKTIQSMENMETQKEKFCLQIAARLKLAIFVDGWPQLNFANVTDFHRAVKQRELQYETLGDLLASSTLFLENNLDYFFFLFESLESEMADLRPTLLLVLSRLTMHLPKLSGHSKEALRLLFRPIITSEKANSAAKFLALKYINMAYPFSDTDARLLCILGTNCENTDEVIEEAKKGLDLYQFSLMHAGVAKYEPETKASGLALVTAMPRFDDFMALLLNESSTSQSGRILQKCLAEAIFFAFHILVMQAIDKQTTVIAVNENWKTIMYEALESNEKVRSLIGAEISRLALDDVWKAKDSAPQNSFQRFMDLTFETLHHQFITFQSIAPSSLLTPVFYLLVKFSPDRSISDLERHLGEIRKIIVDSSIFNELLRQLVKCFAVVGTQPSVPASYISETRSVLVDKGAAVRPDIYLYTMAVIISRLSLRKRLAELDAEVVFSFLLDIEEALKVPQLYDACLFSIGELAIYGVLGPNKTSAQLTQTINAFYDIILPRAKACHEPSLFAITKLALATQEIYDNLSEGLLDVELLVFGTHIAKNIEFAFAAGECLLILAGGWLSKFLQQNIDIQGTVLSIFPQRTSRGSVVLSEVLSSARLTKPSLRKASCIWLLAMVQYLGHTTLFNDRATEIHAAFLRFLSDRDEVVQECASRGLEIIYDLGNADLKETLVKSLIHSFIEISGSLPSGSVSADTQLFDHDSLYTHDGPVSTYRDVLSLATDVGDPSLVYKFMALAKANTSWTLRRGMAFGLGKILSRSNLDSVFSQDLTTVQRLIPRLFRYRFDPNQSVAQSMNYIWAAIFPDSTVVKNNFEPILVEVLKSMTSREWRVRQASVCALEALLQTQSIVTYELHLEEIWNTTFRCMDDIKGTVRKEANKLAKTLARTLVKLTDVSTGNSSILKATELIGHVVPFLLGNRGLLSDAEEVKHFALETILSLCGSGGISIKSFIPDLICTFVELMSSLEPEMVNYLVLNADKYSLSGNNVDTRRLQSLGLSPLLEAIEKLTAHVDEDLMCQLVPTLKTSIRKSVGLPSKVCGSRVIVLLVTKLGFLAQPYSDELLKISRDNLKDRNSAVSSSFAMAAGYCCQLASLKAVVCYGTELSTLYFDKSDTKARMIAALGSNSVSKFAGSDKLNAVATAYLPLAFIGKHDEDAEVLKLFESEWIENASVKSSIKLYFEEISRICGAQITSSDYTIRRVIARSLAEMSALVDNFSNDENEQLLQLLLYGCKGKSWVGKELVFDALILFSVKNSSLLKFSPFMEQVVDTIHTEVKRRSKAYQFRAIQSMAKFLSKFPQFPDLVKKYIDVMDTVLDDKYLEEIDVISEKRNNEKLLKSQHAVQTEEAYLSLIKNIASSLAPNAYSKDLNKFLRETTSKFLKSGRELSWRTCVEYNEIVKNLLEILSTVELEQTALEEFSQFYELLFQFGDEYKLERSLVLLARNCGAALKMLKRYDYPAFRDIIVLNLNELKIQSHSSVATAEIANALALS